MAIQRPHPVASLPTVVDAGVRWGTRARQAAPTSRGTLAYCGRCGGAVGAENAASSARITAVPMRDPLWQPASVELERNGPDGCIVVAQEDFALGEVCLEFGVTIFQGIAEVANLE